MPMPEWETVVIKKPEWERYRSTVQDELLLRARGDDAHRRQRGRRRLRWLLILLCLVALVGAAALLVPQLRAYVGTRWRANSRTRAVVTLAIKVFVTLSVFLFVVSDTNLRAFRIGLSLRLVLATACAALVAYLLKRW